MAYDVKSVNTTLCYLRRGEDYLMLHRVKKQNDVNQDKWIGVGGKFEADESPEDCLLREVREETGLNLTHAMVPPPPVSWPCPFCWAPIWAWSSAGAL